MKTAYEEMKAELDRRQNPTLLESLQDYYDKKTQGRPPLSNFCAEMKRRGKNLSNLQEFAKSINYLQTHKIETMEDLQERIDELNSVVSVSKKEISEKREQLKKLENLEKMAEVIKTNQCGLGVVPLYSIWKTDNYSGQSGRGKNLFCNDADGSLYK